MLHLRIISPSVRTDAVLDLIDTTVGTTHLAVLKGAARDPEGDIVMVDVAREAGDELLYGLRKLEIDKVGSIAVDDIGLSLSDRAGLAEEEAPGEAADAVIWEQLTETSQEESTLTITYAALMIVATMIAACGVVLDNAVLIVGAMAVGPEFGPLAGISTGLVRRERRAALRSLVALLVGFAAAIAATTLFSLVMDAFGLFREGMLDAQRPNTGFIFQPDPFSFVVALLAGVAGVVSMTSSKAGVLVGVAISVTTVPAAANAAVALSYGDLVQMWGSAEQLLINLGGIIVAGVLTLIGWKLLWRTQRGRMTRPPGAPRKF
ncbi:DUF389 domain-containing protein [Streptomyces sp. Je 1-79]|uniref:DUF389 domain-containing protein n=1 Tax=Streptomyces sp. Je 1-79 TaxID=2943847 RepID=UPI0021A43801|nr:DUF389 domain-containing protein [Streptomyces sp. Je 1-79]MCT4355772.1 DUF389 domain-containing protein [Streptomyces sp. Je 1-79]